MTGDRDGQVVTFYSFKGGTGRTMALANVAWILAANGKRVLVADWDLESPGLHRFFHPFMAEAAVLDSPGVSDLIRAYQNEARRRLDSGKSVEDIADYARVSRYAFSLDWRFPEEGTVDFLSSGRQNNNYAVTISGLEWDDFYGRLGGGRLFGALRADMKRNYDYTLIDSRTGLSDVADICTIELPDTLVDCFTLSIQGIEGAAQVANALTTRYSRRRGGKGIRVLPVPMRVEDAEKAKADAGRAMARARFTGLPAGMSAFDRAAYWGDVEIPYRPFYAYEETLATFGDEEAGPRTLLAAFERLTRHVTRGEVTAMPPMDQRVRESWLRRFERSATGEPGEVALHYVPEDHVWAEWVERVLTEAKVTVRDYDPAERMSAEPGSPRVLAVVSPAYKATHLVSGAGAGRRLSALTTGLPADASAVYVSDMRPLERFPVGNSTHLYGLPPAEAADRLTRLIGCAPLDRSAHDALALRFPGDEPKVSNIPARNTRFTGRDAGLRDLRAELRAQGTAVVLPVAIQGFGGVGKTQLAVEYAHRYKSDYEIIWWIQCGQPQFIDTAISDLGAEVTQVYQADLGVGVATAGEIARNVVRMLSRPDLRKRWLLVFDNAEDPDAVKDFLPSGSGHLIITSRNRAWSERAHSLDVDVFDRTESVAHLMQRVERITPEEADQVAEAVGDLPLAVATSGAWLQETLTTVPEYLHQLEEHGPLAVSSALADYPAPIAAAWDLSLDQVRRRSAAAYRLLELCSVLSPDGIALDLVYSPAMVTALSEFDPTLAEPGDIARVVQLVNRLALITLNALARQFQMHRLLQAVVRQRMTADELASARHQIHLLLASARPRRDVDDPDTWARYRMLWPHLEPSNAVECPDELVRNLLIDRVRYLYIRGDLDNGVGTAHRIDTAWQPLLDGEDDEDAATLRKQLLHMRFNLGNILREQGNYDEARDLDGEVLREQQELLGLEHRHSLMTAGGLAADMRARGQYAEGLELATRTYETWLSVFGEDYTRTLDAAHNLAISYRLVGRYAEARELDDITYERRRTVLPPHHPRTFNSASSLGRDMREAGRYQDSVAWLGEQLQLAQAELEPNALPALELQVGLAASLRAAGRPEEAAPLFDSAYERLASIYGPKHYDTLTCQLGRSANLGATDRPDLADRELRAVLDSYRTALGPEHPLTLVCVSNHVPILSALGAAKEALAAAIEAKTLLLKALGPNYPYSLAAAMNLAGCLAGAGQLDEARSLDEETTTILTAMVGPEHPDTLRARANLALTRRQLGEPGADAEATRITELLGRHIGRDHPTVTALRESRRARRVIDPQTF